jgi:TRAP transporter TAXI family solute receptor
MRIQAAVLLIAAALAGGGCHQQAAAGGRTTVRLVRDTTISEPLALEFARTLPGVEMRLVEAGGSVATVEAIQRGDADLGFVLADVAYFAYVRQAEHPAPLGQLRGIAALQITPVHLLLRQGLADHVTAVGDLGGYKVSTGAGTSGQALLAGLVLRAFGLGSDAVRRPLASLDFLAASLAEGAVDAAFATAYYPATSVLNATARGARLLPIDGPAVERLRQEYPFIRNVSIPAGTYPGQTDVVRTIGVDRLLVCRSDLDERLAHDLTKEFLAALPRLASSLRSSLRLMDLDQVPATPIPLHKGAAQYYREWELTR